VFSVEIRIPEMDEKALTARMNAMREWLDHRRVEPSVFRYTFDPPGLLYRVDFRTKSDAVAFANQFGGQVIPTFPEMEAVG
jgi:hypothetical protein